MNVLMLFGTTDDRKASLGDTHISPRAEGLTLSLAGKRIRHGHNNVFYDVICQEEDLARYRGVHIDVVIYDSSFYNRRDCMQVKSFVDAAIH